MRLLRAELLKLGTTRTGWLLTAVTLVVWAGALLVNTLLFNGEVQADPTALLLAQTNFYTTGQLAGMTVALVLGTVVITAEFQYRTALPTFLVSPGRTAVILAKGAAAALGGLALWALTTALNLALGPLVLADGMAAAALHRPEVWTAVALNGATFAVWPVLGVGLGALVRHQAGAAAAALGINFAGTLALVAGLAGLTELVGHRALEWATLIPSLASFLLVFGVPDPGLPPRWVAGVVLVGYAVAALALGTALVRRRDLG
ncbi:hypothetical protein GCM10010124_07600 [Pilimelia terevasa]|uniref:ABC transporter permease n=1 Tax=Pilimelia terevasa TaxID=53372 RepID=A0A8J3BKK6_9ACTN|nr:ABC transporter permease [Pilimelia terevasa]GGK17533.1 hypothetical protein GCM10010124_07600 [Pilimelia terevasa]